jgi:NAD(P)H-dependent FMN reductase
MSKPKIAVVIGSTRANRFADKPAAWIAEIGKARGDLDFEIVDLKDYPMPLFAEATSPKWGASEDETARKWQAKLSQFDGFVFLAAEYNHAPTGVLKNALDYAGEEWGRKPAGFVGYGGVGGARAVEQLRMIAIELQMAPVKAGVHIVWPDYLAVANNEKKLEEMDHLNQAATALLDDVAWWAKVLKTARENDVKLAEAA